MHRRRIHGNLHVFNLKMLSVQLLAYSAGSSIANELIIFKLILLKRLLLSFYLHSGELRPHKSLCIVLRYSESLPKMHSCWTAN